MAANTILNATLQARDWEYLVGIIWSDSSADTQDLITRLRNSYAAATPKPSGTSTVSVQTTEGEIVDLYGKISRTETRVTQTNNGQPYSRIKAALLAMNNVADNYISTEMAVIDAAADNARNEIRRFGRRHIMMREFID